MKQVIIYTDGSCLGNPGSGGYGAILSMITINGEHRKEISGGFSLTTNNRMELMAAIVALETLKESCAVLLFTDSKYLKDAIESKWLINWKKNGWKTANKKDVKNKDLWQRLDIQIARHSVSLKWVKGHAGNVNNERCDELARAEASKAGLPQDLGYEESK